MTLLLTAPVVDVTDKITAGADTEFYLGKPRRNNNTRPAFGSQIELRGTALSGGESSIDVRPLKEDLPPGTILPFPSGSITLNSGATKGAISIDNVTVPVATYAQGEIAKTSDIEQVITLAQDVTVGDRSIIVNALDELLEKGRILTLPGGFEFQASKDRHHEAGEQEIFGELLSRSIGSLSGVIANTGGTIVLPEYELICSADSIQNQNNSQSLTDYLFKDGPDASKDVVTRDRTFTITGKELKSDFAYDRLVEQTLGGIQSSKEKCYFIAVSGLDGRQVGGRCIIGNESLNANVNQRNTLNATIEVDGKLSRYNYPHLAIAA